MALRTLALVLLSCFASHSWALQQADRASGSEKSAVNVKDNANPTRKDISQWVMGYYRQPQPDLIADKVRKMSELKMLQTDRPAAHEMFLGRVMAANPKRIADWMNGWMDLPELDRQMLQRAVWMSQTDEGKAWLKEHGHAELAAKEAHPLLTGGAMVLEPYHMDMLWEWYFATGEAAPVKQIVGKYNLLTDDPGAEGLPQRPAPGADRATMLRQAIGGSAVWSSASLASSHDRLLVILKEIQPDPQLPPRAGAWLKRVIEIAERNRKAAPAP